MKTVKFFFSILAVAFSFQFATAQTADITTTVDKADLALIMLTDGSEKPAQFAQSGAKVVSVYQEGMAITRLGERYGFVNRQGNEIVSPRFEEVRFFENGYAAVRQAGMWTFINKQGKKLTTARYDWVGNFCESGTAAVKFEGKWGFINEQGIEITPIKYEQIRQFGADGRALVKFNGKWLFVDIYGKETPVSDSAQAAALEARPAHL